jgi:hypothetical protein
MPPPSLASLCLEWRQGLFSDLPWERDPANTLAAGEAGGYQVKATGYPHCAYLKPVRVCDEHNPRGANEKIVADLAQDLGFNVPPVLLHRRLNALLGEEIRCCVSLIMYPEQYEWGMIWDLSIFPPPVQHLIRESLSHYSKTFALDLLIGQTDRNNARNVILGVGSGQPRHTELLFLDHSYTLNYGNRWANNAWSNLEMVPIPPLFRESLDKTLVLEGADDIAQFSEETIQQIVARIPSDYMSDAHKATVATALVGRKNLIRDFVDRNL